MKRSVYCVVLAVFLTLASMGTGRAASIGNLESENKNLNGIVAQNVNSIGETEAAEPDAETPEEETVPQETVPYATIERLYQNNYSHRFGRGNVASSGCGITCVAMLARYYYEYDYTPDDMAHWFGYGINTAACMEIAIENLELPLEAKYYGDAVYDYVWDALAEGKIVLALLMKDSIFTDEGHFVLYTGVTEDGKYMVNDPNLANADKIDLVEGFTNGFSKEDVAKGLSGIYIFSAKEDFPCDRENPPIFD